MRVLKSFEDLAGFTPKAQGPRILPDTTQPRMRAQFPGARRVYPGAEAFDIGSEGSYQMARTWPDLDVHAPKLDHSITYGPHSPRKGSKARVPRKRETRLYVPSMGHGEGLRALIIDRSNGQVLARVTGDKHHLFAEATKLALSQGFTIADLEVIPDPDTILGPIP